MFAAEKNNSSAKQNFREWFVGLNGFQNGLLYADLAFLKSFWLIKLQIYLVTMHFSIVFGISAFVEIRLSSGFFTIPKINCIILAYWAGKKETSFSWKSALDFRFHLYK